MISGDFAKLAQLVKNFEELADTASKMVKDLEPIAKDLVLETFGQRTDPHGHAWAPHRPNTIKRWGSHPLLELTGKMKPSLRAIGLGTDKLALTMASPAGYHQNGTSHMVPRPVFPYLGKLPSTWVERFKEAGFKAIRNKMTRGW